uniref:Peptidase_M13 domain-containing protein n=1 Tax=Meloidogyne hapla TaxID=6305 RepID=A0A1I8AY92_MELHA
MSKIYEKYSNNLQRFSNWDEPELYVESGELSSLYLPSSISIDFVKILNEIASEGNPLINEKTKILILGKEILNEYRLIIEWAENEDEGKVLSDYLDWALIWRILYELDERFSNLLNSYKKDEIVCMRNFVKIYFKHWLDKLYLNNIIDKNIIEKNIIEQIENIFSFVKKSFEQLINEADWIGDESKNKAKLKLNKMKQNIGYYKLIEDNLFLNKLYKNYKINENMSWIEMFIQLNRNYYLWPTIDYQASFFVDGYYKWAFNSLAIYGGIMYSPWFDPKLPESLNFGGIGTLLGHETSHGFDSFGFNFDENGDRIDEKEIDKETNEKMEEKFKCFIKQYSNYENENLRPNSRFTLSENIADNAGIRASYKAWKLFTNSLKKFKNLKMSLNEFTDEQMFFIGNAFTYCSVMTEEDKNNYAKTDNHAFPKGKS